MGVLTCPVCGAAFGEEPWLARADVSVWQNLLYKTEADARACPRGELRFFVCERCGFAHNVAFDSEKVRYQPQYELDQTGSARYVAHLDELATTLLEAVEGPIRLLEVGVGRGTFLRRLIRLAGERFSVAAGFDPALEMQRMRDLPESVALYPHELDQGRLDFVPNVVVARHIVEHLAEPVAFLSGVKTELQGRVAANCPLFVETPDVDYSIERSYLHDFYYEHCSLFSPDALKTALTSAGFGAVRLRHVFGTEYMLATADWSGSAESPSFSIRKPPASATQVLNQWQRRLREFRGPVGVWGAAGKGVTFVQLVDPKRRLVECLVDVNPAKAKSFVPLTAHPIIDRDEARARKLKTVVVMNENYLDEVRADCSDWPSAPNVRGISALG